MSKHTPGPWWANGIEVGAGPLMQVKVAKAGGATYEEAKANAKLLAAAPDLLKALEPFVRYSSSNEVIRIEVRTADIKTARAAIAKATGGEL